MKVYTKSYNAALGQFVSTSTEVTVVSKTSVAKASDLPTSGNSERDGRYALDSNHFYVYLNGAWNDQGYLPNTSSSSPVPPVNPGNVGDELDIPEEDINFKSSVATTADLPASGNVANDAVYVRDTNHLHIYLNNQWNDQGVFDISDIVEEYIFQAIS